MKKAIIPGDLLKSNILLCEEDKYTTICPTCEHLVGVNLHPYFYDEDEGDVYFVAICPECGELLISKS